MAGGSTWRLSMRMVFMLSCFLAAGLKIVGYTQKPKPRSTCTQHIGAKGPNEHLFRRRSFEMVGLCGLSCIRQCLIVAAIAAITPAFGADPDNGERLARRWCSPCHVVASNQ